MDKSQNLYQKEHNMQLTRWNPRMRRGLQRNLFPTLMDDFFYPLHRNESFTSGKMMPSVDIYEKDDKVFFEAEVPGFDKENLKVDVKGKVLTLSGEKKEESEEKGQSYRRERFYGSFERSFQLGFEADDDAIEAKYESGILTIAVTKPAEQQKKQIEIH